VFTDAMTNLFTPDINRAVAFYRDLVGFTQTFQYPAMGQPEHAEFRLGHFMLALSRVEAARTVSLPEPRPGNLAELVIWCDGLPGDGSYDVEVLVEMPFSRSLRQRHRYQIDTRTRQLPGLEVV